AAGPTGAPMNRRAPMSYALRPAASPRLATANWPPITTTAPARASHAAASPGRRSLAVPFNELGAMSRPRALTSGMTGPRSFARRPGPAGRARSAAPRPVVARGAPLAPGAVGLLDLRRGHAVGLGAQHVLDHLAGIGVEG